ncbi:hypothetical protein [Azospirillum soli]|uniref:hypothetical protein n=1 Tax=Azospirillum soli TaxID=1304799 RepID=UPI001AE8A2EF|nr:hypothetical protein [Azospirillum soli]MBP2312845.1 hypothetical protein [Azospirillum soli]
MITTHSDVSSTNSPSVTFPSALPSAADLRRIRREAEEIRAETIRNIFRKLITALSGFGRAPSLRLGERRA